MTQTATSFWKSTNWNSLVPEEERELDIRYALEQLAKEDGDNRDWGYTVWFFVNSFPNREEMMQKYNLTEEQLHSCVVNACIFWATQAKGRTNGIDADDYRRYINLIFFVLEQREVTEKEIGFSRGELWEITHKLVDMQAQNPEAIYTIYKEQIRRCIETLFTIGDVFFVQVLCHKHQMLYFYATVWDECNIGQVKSSHKTIWKKAQEDLKAALGESFAVEVRFIKEKEMPALERTWWVPSFESRKFQSDKVKDSA